MYIFFNLSGTIFKLQGSVLAHAYSDFLIGIAENVEKWHFYSGDISRKRDITQMF